MKSKQSQPMESNINDDGQYVVPGIKTDHELRQESYEKLEREATTLLGKISDHQERLLKLGYDDCQETVYRLKILLATIDAIYYLMTQSNNVGSIHISRTESIRTGNITVEVSRKVLPNISDDEVLTESVKIKKLFMVEKYDIK